VKKHKLLKFINYQNSKKLENSKNLKLTTFYLSKNSSKIDAQ